MTLNLRISELATAVGNALKLLTTRVTTLESASNLNHAQISINQAARLIQTQNTTAKQYRENHNE